MLYLPFATYRRVSYISILSPSAALPAHLVDDLSQDTVFRALLSTHSKWSERVHKSLRSHGQLALAET